MLGSAEHIKEGSGAEQRTSLQPVSPAPISLTGGLQTARTEDLLPREFPTEQSPG